MNIRTADLFDLNAIAGLELRCFPSAEACSPEKMKERFLVFHDRFWLGEENGEMISYIGGMRSDEATLRDEMYADSSLHVPDGMHQMLFSVCTLPAKQHLGYAGAVMHRVILDCLHQGLEDIVLTCKARLIGFYHRFGFVSEGLSSSDHGGACWYQMRLCLTGRHLTILKVIEDDFGCEGLPDDSEKQVTLIVQAADGCTEILRMPDALALDRRLEPGCQTLQLQDNSLIRIDP